MAKTPHRSQPGTPRRAPVYRLPGTSGEVSMDSPGEEIRARAARIVCRLARDEEERTGLLSMLGLDTDEGKAVAGRLPKVR
ncbi:hypothetical protein SAMN04489731_11626 [Amycolatopsis regifaucium]|nr:hypothetical protein SAMN04489731_11626 [Amycolatopsis regifaucium]